MTAAAALSLVPSPPPDAPRPRRLVAVRTIELPLRPPPPPGQLCLFANEPPVATGRRPAARREPSVTEASVQLALDDLASELGVDTLDEPRRSPSGSQWGESEGPPCFAADGQIGLFADEPPVVPAKRLAPPPPAPLPSGEVQVALPLGRSLPLIDVHRVTRGRCLVQHDGCPATTCRHRFDEVATFRGRRFGCSLAVARAYPHGLPPQYVARLLGMDEEGEVQRVEHVGLEHLRAESRDAFGDWRE